MLTIEEKSELFYIYYEKWIRIYKEGAIRNVTMRKYEITLLWLKKLVPELKLSQLNRISYQQLLNDYAEFHERQTTMDFHHQIKEKKSPISLKNGIIRTSRKLERYHEFLQS